MNSVINLPDGQVNFFEEFNLQKNCEINLLIKTFCGQVEMIFGLVNVSFSLPEWQAVKMTVFAPCICGGKFPLKTPGNAISETLYFKISLDASALKNLCLWCEFQSRLLFLISLLLKNLLTPLRQTYLQHYTTSQYTFNTLEGQITFKIHCSWSQIFLVNIPGKEYIIINHYHFIKNNENSIDANWPGDTSLHQPLL